MSVNDFDHTKSLTVMSRVTGRHPSTTSRDGGIRRTCCVCGNQRKANGELAQLKTNNYCLTCNTYMHHKECWNLYHSEDY